MAPATTPSINAPIAPQITPATATASAAVADPGWRVLVVDDSIVVRATVRAMLAERPEVALIETARCARSALEVLERLAATTPIDVVLLDVEMPTMTGIEALPHLLRASPSSRVVMASSLTRRGATVTMAALAAGAADYVCNPSAASPGQQQAFRADLVAKVAIWGEHARRERQARARPPAPGQPFAPAVLQPAARASPAPAAAAATLGLAPGGAAMPGRWRRDQGRAAAVEARLPRLAALAIGTSTGGPQALLQLLGSPLACPIFITQHMPPAFTALLADQIGRLTGGTCREAEDGEAATAGRIYVAPGNHHMLVRAAGPERRVIRLSSAAAENSCRPSVDPMLRSLARVYGERLCAVILTGMGHDGLAGCRQVRQEGGLVLVQDKTTSVVWGMPGAVARDGLAAQVLPIPAIAGLLRPRLGCQR